MDKTTKYKEIIEKSNVIFLPFNGSEEVMNASSDKRVVNEFEMKRRYPGQSFIRETFELNGSNGYLLVSKHYLRENIPSLKRAKASELKKEAENMMVTLLRSLYNVDRAYEFSRKILEITEKMQKEKHEDKPKTDLIKIKCKDFAITCDIKD